MFCNHDEDPAIGMGRKGSKQNHLYHSSRQSITAVMLAKKRRPTIPKNNVIKEESKVEDIFDNNDLLLVSEDVPYIPPGLDLKDDFEPVIKSKSTHSSRAAAQRSNWQQNEVTESLDEDIQSFLRKQENASAPQKVIDTRPTVDTKPTLANAPKNELKEPKVIDTRPTFNPAN